MKPRDLNEAVDQLVQRQRIRVPHDDGTWTWKTTPSLWEMLLESVGRTGGTGSGHSNVARIPISATAIDLIRDIRATAAAGAKQHAGSTRPDTPGDLRAVAANITEDEDHNWWTDKLIGWTVQARGALQLDPEWPRWARGVHCPACGAVHADGHDGVERTRVPALAVTWAPPEDDGAYHTDDEWQVRAITCGACKETWWGVNGALVLGGMLYANTNHETMTEGTMSA